MNRILDMMKLEMQTVRKIKRVMAMLEQNTKLDSKQ